ncbi:MAG TPA: hypothetical protein VNU68_32175 [Verrucomicrobiae bacterium]|nr:hypothetical protein [Verrucomicrobiae bacterium]
MTSKYDPKRKPSKPRLVKSDKLCGHLARIAAFNLSEWPAAQAKVYAAIKQLQQLDAAAIEAGLKLRRS